MNSFIRCNAVNSQTHFIALNINLIILHTCAISFWAFQPYRPAVPNSVTMLKHAAIFYRLLQYIRPQTGLSSHFVTGQLKRERSPLPKTRLKDITSNLTGMDLSMVWLIFHPTLQNRKVLLLFFYLHDALEVCWLSHTIISKHATCSSLSNPKKYIQIENIDWWMQLFSEVGTCDTPLHSTLSFIHTVC